MIFFVFLELYVPLPSTELSKRSQTLLYGNSDNEENCKNFSINLSNIRQEDKISRDNALTGHQTSCNEDSEAVNKEFLDLSPAERQTNVEEVETSSYFKNVCNLTGADSDKLPPKIAARIGKNSSHVKIDEDRQERDRAGATEKEQTRTTNKTQMFNNRKSDISALQKKESVYHKKSVYGNTRKVNMRREPNMLLMICLSDITGRLLHRHGAVGGLQAEVPSDPIGPRAPGGTWILMRTLL